MLFYVFILKNIFIVMIVKFPCCRQPLVLMDSSQRLIQDNQKSHLGKFECDPINDDSQNILLSQAFRAALLEDGPLCLSVKKYIWQKKAKHYKHLDGIGYDGIGYDIIKATQSSLNHKKISSFLAP